MHDKNDVQALRVGSKSLNVMAQEIRETLAILAGLLNRFPRAEGLGMEVDICIVDNMRYYFKTSRWAEKYVDTEPQAIGDDIYVRSGAEIYLYSEKDGKAKSYPDSLPLQAIEPIHEQLGLIMDKIEDIEPRIRPFVQLLIGAGKQA